MKKILVLLCIVSLTSCASAQFGDLLKQVEKTVKSGTIPVQVLDVSGGLKQALNLGISKQVTKLTATDGFFKNEMVKILLPEELKKVDAGLRKIGMGKLADDGLRAINRAAEDAVKEATPIFVDAVTNMSFADAKNILMGNESAATSYLQGSTNTTLYGKFNPVIKTSFAKVGADKIWDNLISKYNSIPFVAKVNPDLTDYVTNQALNGVFKMIAVEEKNIRGNAIFRTTDLLKKVFAMQDKL